MQTGHDQSGDVRDISHDPGAYAPGDLANPLEVDR